MTLTILKAKCFPNMGKRGANLPLFAQGRGEPLQNRQLEQVGLLTVRERNRSLTFFENR